MGILRDLRHWRFWRKFLTYSFAAVGALSVLAGIVDVFNPGALDGQNWILWFCLSLAVVFGVWRAWPRPVEAIYDSPQTRIRVVRDDIFNQDAHLVIGACDTFDTAAPYIAPNSVQGQFVDRVYGGDIAHLDEALESGLAEASVVEGAITKPGKSTRYALGTVAVVRVLARRYFFVAYTSMDTFNKAHGTADALWKGLANLWDSVRIESNGTAVAIPVVGGGQSGLSPVLPAEDAVRFIALSYMMASRENKVCDELRIVALPAQYDRLDHLELQAFLSALER